MNLPRAYKSASKFWSTKHDKVRFMHNGNDDNDDNDDDDDRPSVGAEPLNGECAYIVQK